MAPGEARVASSVTGVADQSDVAGSHHLPPVPPWRTAVTTVATPALSAAVPLTVRLPTGLATVDPRSGDVIAVAGMCASYRVEVVDADSVAED
jgi:hypothetical protein